MKTFRLSCRNTILELGGAPLIMGILNVTPDSFSDGDEYLEPAAAVRHGLDMVDQGADIIDVGGESTRPASEPVTADEQIRRVGPVIWTLSRQTDVPISIDTTDSRVAEAALEAGASIINDVSALRRDPAMAELARQCQAPVILMHMLGTPQTMQDQPTYDDVVQDIMRFLAERMAFAAAAGIEPANIVLDPGLGFGKTPKHNLTILRHLHRFHELGPPLLVGPSRKSFIGKVLEIDSPRQRIFGTAAAVATCAAAGAQIIRVHDVRAMRQVALLAAAIQNA
ncbi:MAG: dihydropteroate synthase [Sedimentisphaerales bacterium]|nr:dihydropteroate synthase [Sedimentisphaerales bacterium]